MEYKRFKLNSPDICISDNRFKQFFDGFSYFSILQNGHVNTRAETARFKEDFNYDIVMQQALANSTAIYMR